MPPLPGPQASDAGFGGGQYKTTLVRLAKIGLAAGNGGRYCVLGFSCHH